MGHEVWSGLLEATTKDEAIKEVMQMKADIEERGRYDYGGYCHFYDRTFNTEEEAERFLGKGGGEGGICMVKDVSESKSLQKLKSKLAEVQQKERDYDLEFKEKVMQKFKERTSSTCSCSECESRYKKEIAIKFNLICPVCSTWMVPDGVRDSYTKAKKKFADMRTNLYMQIDAQRKKDAANTNRIRYYYLLDYHC